MILALIWLFLLFVIFVIIWVIGFGGKGRNEVQAMLTWFYRYKIQKLSKNSSSKKIISAIFRYFMAFSFAVTVKISKSVPLKTLLQYFIITLQYFGASALVTILASNFRCCVCLYAYVTSPAYT